MVEKVNRLPFFGYIHNIIHILKLPIPDMTHPTLYFFMFLQKGPRFIRFAQVPRAHHLGLSGPRT